MIKALKNIFIFLIIPASLIHSQVTGLSGWDICIDPGHSQHENMGISGFSEAEEVVRVGLQLRSLLSQNTDIDTVYMTRTNDQQVVGLYDRSVYANTVGATWFHSIHSDAGATSSNRTLLLWGQLYNGTPDPPVGGEGMAAIIIDILTRGMRIATSGSWGDCSFYGNNICNASWPGPYLSVNRNTLMPSELREEGHHTNPAQNQLAMNSGYQRLLAYTFYWSILKHQNVSRPPVRICTGIIRNVETDIPINGATISIGDRSVTTDTWESLFNQYTDDPDAYHNGFYFFDDLSDSNWTLVVSADGYDPDTLEVTPIDTFFTFRDINLVSNVPPTIVETNPAEGDSSFPAWDPIEINFSRPMNPSVTEASFQIEPYTTGSFSWTNHNQRMDFTPDSIQFVTDYTVTIGESAQDTYSHYFDGDSDGIPGGEFQLHFRTSPSDIFPPEIQSVYPSMSSNNIEINPIVRVTFDEVIGNPDTLFSTIYVQNFSSGEIVGTQLGYYIVNNQTVVNLFPDDVLNPGSIYITRVSPGISDRFGNSMGIWHSFSFSTGSTTPVINLIDDFESGLTSNWWTPSQSGSSVGYIADSTDMSANTEIVNLLTGSTTSMDVRYGWDENAPEWLLREYLGGGLPRGMTFTGNDILQCYVFGDGSGNQFRFAVDDHLPSTAAEYHEVSPWITVDWIGWKRVRWNMATDGTGTWLGDGNLDGNLRIDSIQLTHVPGQPSTGHFIFDDLSIVSDEEMNTENNSEIPNQFSLSQNYPNPFNPVTTIQYSANKESTIRLIIYNVRGQQVRKLVSGLISAGNHSATWDGRDDYGSLVSTGTYIYRLEKDGKSISRKLVFIK